MVVTRAAWSRALGALIATALLAVVLSGSWVGLLRDRFHYGCEYQSDGEFSSWACPDGIGYIMPGLGILVLEGVIGLATLNLLLRFRGSFRTATWRALAGLGVAPIAVLGVVVALTHPTGRLPTDAIAAIGAIGTAFGAAAAIAPDLLGLAVIAAGLPIVAVLARPRPDRVHDTRPL